MCTNVSIEPGNHILESMGTNVKKVLKPWADTGRVESRSERLGDSGVDRQGGNKKSQSPIDSGGIRFHLPGDFVLILPELFASLVSRK
jgi:hypothetical protein